MKSQIRKLFVLVVALFPSSRVKNHLLRLAGWQVGAGVHIGPNLIVGIEQVMIGQGARLGAFNVVRGLASLSLGDFARLGQWNWISAAAPLRSAGGSATLHLGAHAAVTSRHYLDVSGGVRIGAFTTVAGVRSTFITHGINWKLSSQQFRGIDIGEYCIVSSNVKVTPGSTVEDGTVIGMGATVAGVLTGGSLYVSDRATRVKPGLSGRYFNRTTGYISEVENEAGKLS